MLSAPPIIIERGSDWTPVAVTSVVAAIFAGLGVMIAAVFTGLVAYRTAKIKTRVDDVHAETIEIHREVKTINTFTVPQMIEAAESRRIVDIPEEDRSDNEKQHLSDIPIPGKHDPPPGPPRTTKTGQPG